MLSTKVVEHSSAIFASTTDATCQQHTPARLTGLREDDEVRLPGGEQGLVHIDGHHAGHVLAEVTQEGGPGRDVP